MLGAVLLLASSGPAAGQQADAVFRPEETADAVLHAERSSWGRYLHEALRLPEWLDLAIDHRSRFELLDGAFRPGEPERQTQFPQRTRLRMGVEGPGTVRLLAELQDARTWNDGPDDFTRNAVDHLDVLQLFAAATHHDLFHRGLRADLHVGRFTLDIGSRRLVARNGFRNTTNSFDGVHMRLADAEGLWRVRGFYTRPVERGEDAFDDAAWSQPTLWGLAFADSRIRWLQVDTVYLDFEEHGRELHTFDLRFSMPPAPGSIDYELEGIAQFGDLAGVDHSAVATHAELGCTFDHGWTPRFAAQFDYASGTGDPEGGDSHTFMPLYGARRSDLAPTGIFGAFPRSNILSPGVRVAVVPAPTLRAEIKVRYWQLAESRDAFVGTGLRDPDGGSGRDLGTDVELQLRWDPLEWLGFDLGYDHWFTGSYLDRVPGGPGGGDTDYFYLATRVRL